MILNKEEFMKIMHITYIMAEEYRVGQLHHQDHYDFVDDLMIRLREKEGAARRKRSD